MELKITSMELLPDVKRETDREDYDSYPALRTEQALVTELAELSICPVRTLISETDPIVRSVYVS